jgi:choice-of-anchor B domain-containing protein
LFFHNALYFRRSDVQARSPVACGGKFTGRLFQISSTFNFPFFMKKNLLLALGICFANFLFAQDSLNMTRLARWDDDALPTVSSINLQYSGCWGLAVNGHEYAVIGGAAHILFFDVTEPTQPELIGKYPRPSATLWREFKSYKNRIYAVSDQTSEGLTIFDMTNAPDTIAVTYSSNEFFTNAHTIALDTASGRVYLNGTSVAELVVLDVSQNPDQPTLLSAKFLAGGYIHDSYVRGDTVYASSGFSGYYIYDFTDPQNPDTLAAISTGGYNHNSWVNVEGTHAYYTEEIPAGRPVQIVDLQNLANNELSIAGAFLDSFLFPGAGQPIPHNVFIKDNLLFNSQYEDGVVVYDISDPVNPVLAGRYDTHPQNQKYNGYFGCWGNYPWLPSGTIIASDMQNGLQLLKLNYQVNTHASNDLEAAVFPNPASESLTIRLPDGVSGWSFKLLSPTGQLLQSGKVKGNSQQILSLKNYYTGLYFLEIQTDEGKKAVRKVVVE